MRRFGGIGMAWLVATVVAVTIAAAAVTSVRSELIGVPTALGVSASPALVEAAADEPQDSPSDSFVTEQAPVPTTVVESLAAEPAGSGPSTTIATAASVTTSTTSTTSTTKPPAAERNTATTEAKKNDEGTKSLPQAGSTSSTSSTPSEQPSPTTTVAVVATTSTTTTRPPIVTATPPTTVPVETAYTRSIDTAGGTVSVLVDGDEVRFRRAFPNSGWRFDLVSGGPRTVEAQFGENDDQSSRLRLVVAVIDGILDISITTSN